LSCFDNAVGLLLRRNNNGLIADQFGDALSGLLKKAFGLGARVLQDEIALGKGALALHNGAWHTDAHTLKQMGGFVGIDDAEG
jgi:hypothetical protein